MTVVRLPLVLLLAGLLSLGGCTLLQPVALYQLDAGNPGVPKQDAGLAVLLGPVSVADYLQRDVMLQRQADGSLKAVAEARWAGNLAMDIDQLLLRQLAWRLDSQRLVLAPAAPGFTPEVQVQLSISRLDSGPQQPAVLEAQWRLLDRKGQLRDSRLVRLEEPHKGSAADQVKAQSLVLQRLAEQLAAAIQPLRGQPVVEEEPRKAPAPAPARAPAQPGPKIPVAEPVRTDMEIFRF